MPSFGALGIPTFSTELWDVFKAAGIEGDFEERVKAIFEKLDAVEDKAEYDEVFRRVAELQRELTAVRDAARDGGDTEAG